MLFVCIISWGFRPKPGHKKLFEKSFLELQKLHQSEVVFLSEVIWNLKSFAKVKWYVRWEILLPTFLSRKVGGTPFSDRKVWSGKA